MDEYVEIGIATLVRRTETSAQFEIKGELHWIPLDQVKYGFYLGYHGTLYVTRWWAEKEGLA